MSTKSIIHVGLASRTDAHDTKPFVDKNGAVGSVVPAPVRSSVLDLLAHANRSGPELLYVRMTARSGSVNPAQQRGHKVIDEHARRTGDTRIYHTSWG